MNKTISFHIMQAPSSQEKKKVAGSRSHVFLSPLSLVEPIFCGPGENFAEAMEMQILPKREH
jgi:hypothetical protein